MFQFFNDFGFTCVVNERCDELRADKNMYYRKIPNSDCDYLVIAKGKSQNPNGQYLFSHIGRRKR